MSATALAARIVTAEADRMASTRSTVSTTRSAGGTTRWTSPSRIASSADRSRPLNSRYLSPAGPMSRARASASAWPRVTPSRPIGTPKRASAAAIRTSHAAASSQPPPMASPCTIAITGTGVAPMARKAAATASL
jgi:hypothetical protein